MQEVSLDHMAAGSYYKKKNGAGYDIVTLKYLRRQGVVILETQRVCEVFHKAASLSRTQGVGRVWGLHLNVRSLTSKCGGGGCGGSQVFERYFQSDTLLYHLAGYLGFLCSECALHKNYRKMHRWCMWSAKCINCQMQR